MRGLFQCRQSAVCVELCSARDWVRVFKDEGGSIDWIRGREWGVIVFRVCLELYKILDCGTFYVHRWGDCWKWLPCECKNVLWCLGAGLTSGTVLPVWRHEYYRKNACAHLSAVQILRYGYCCGMNVYVHYTWLWNLNLFDLLMYFYNRDRLVFILRSLQICLSVACYVLNGFVECCLYGRLSVNLSVWICWWCIWFLGLCRWMWSVCICFLAVLVTGVVWECTVCKVLMDRNYYGEYLHNVFFLLVFFLV